VSLIIGCLLGVSAGTVYVFSLYSQDLAKLINTPNIDILGSVADLGNCLGVFGSFLLVGKIGQRVGSLVATILSVLGYILIWLTLNDYILPRLWILCIAYFCFGIGQHISFLIAVYINLKNWEARYASRITGLLSATIVFSPIIYCYIYTSTLDSNLSTFFLTLAIMSAAFGLVAILFLKNIGEVEISYTEDDIVADEEEEDEVMLEGEEHKLITNTPRHSNVEVVVKEYTAPEIFYRVEFYLLWFSLLLCLGSCLVWKNLFGKIYFDYHYTLNNVMLLVVWSLTDGISRLIFWKLQNWCRFRIPRPAWTVIPIILLLCSSVLYLFDNLEPNFIFLHITYAIGMASMYSIIPILHGIYWGSTNAALNWAILFVSPGIGGILHILVDYLIEDILIVISVATVMLVISLVLVLWLSSFHNLNFKNY